MKKIPKADQVLKQHLIVKLAEGKDSSEDRASAIEDAMIEFARLHVRAALEVATKKVEEYRAWGDADKIRKSYPKSKIV